MVLVLIKGELVMEITVKATSKDWQLRIRLAAAICMAFFAVVYMVYYSIPLVELQYLITIQNFISKILFLLIILPIAIVLHVSLGLWKLYNRNTLRIPLWEAAQICFGALIPFFLLIFVLRTYGPALIFGKGTGYIDQILFTYPKMSWLYVSMVVVIWTHAQIGVHNVVKLRKWYPKVKLIIIILFTLLPLLGIWGWLKAGEQLDTLFRNSSNSQTQESEPSIDSYNSDYSYSNNDSYNYSDSFSYSNDEFILYEPSYVEKEFLKIIEKYIILFFIGLYTIVLSARFIRIMIMNNNKSIEIEYPDGKNVKVFPKTSILEASRINHIDHASICGGRGRCTTCRVKVVEGENNLSSIGERERKALNRIEAGEHIRLACQAECEKGKIAITPLLPPEVESSKARNETKYSAGSEVELAVMFTDIRGFTKLSEEKFPYDVVFILNRYFKELGSVIEKHNGVIDKFLGDGIMCYFGLGSEPGKACLDALKAAKEMAIKLKDINDKLKNALKDNLEIGIGINYGPVILGELGYKNNMHLTIIGDTVNTASRLEAANKEAKSQLIFSKNMLGLAKLDLPNIKDTSINVRGRKTSLDIAVVTDIISELGNI